MATDRAPRVTGRDETTTVHSQSLFTRAGGKNAVKLVIREIFFFFFFFFFFFTAAQRPSRPSQRLAVAARERREEMIS